MTSSGRCGSRSTFWRRLEMWTSQARSSPSNSVCQSSSMIWRRAKTSPGRLTRSRRSWNSERVRLTGTPSIIATWRTRSIATGPASIRTAWLSGPRVELAAAQLRSYAAEQLAHREGLGDVVVGADLEPDHLVDLGVLGGEDDDRYGAARAHVAADVEAAGPRHHDVEDQQVVGDRVAD